MIAYRSTLQGQGVNPYSISIKRQNNEIVPLGSSIAYGFANDPGLYYPNIIIGNNVSNISGLLYNCANFRANLLIPNGVKTCFDLFRFCRNLNQNIYLPDSVENLGQAFADCISLNQNIRIPLNVESCIGLFYNCRALNQNIYIPNTVKNCESMFEQCIVLSQNIKIPENAINCADMFKGAGNLDFKNLYIPENVNDVVNMLCGSGFEAPTYKNPINIYFNAKTYKKIYIRSMVGHIPVQYQSGNVNTSVRKNIFFNAALNNIFNRSSGETIVGSSYPDNNIITWTPMVNGFYNALYNFYCYYNY